MSGAELAGQQQNTTSTTPHRPPTQPPFGVRSVFQQNFQ
jgi:hypothetical protein